MAQKRGCSPWAYAGCGCGFVAMIGIAIVFASLIFQHLNATRNPAADPKIAAMCQENLRYLGVGLAAYCKDHDGHMPATLAELYPTYLISQEKLDCPLQKLGRGKPYIYTPAARKPVDAVVTCRNHAQGPLILQRDGRLRVAQ